MNIFDATQVHTCDGEKKSTTCHPSALVFVLEFVYKLFNGSKKKNKTVHALCAIFSTFFILLREYVMQAHWQAK